MNPTYQDSTQAMRRQARTELMVIVAERWAAAKERARDAEQAELSSLNHLREAGLAIQKITQHERIERGDFDSMRDELPPDMTIGAVKFCLSLANQFPEPVQTLEESRMARRAVFEKLKIEAPTTGRAAPQIAHTKNAWADFVSGSLSFTRLLKPLELEEPMAKWDRKKLLSFVNATKGIAEKHLAAQKLLK